jgi:uncharacterized protein (TIGR03083 family)
MLGSMDYATFVEHVRLDGNRLADAASGDLALKVPSCPDWVVRDVVTHVATVYEHKILCTTQGKPPKPWPPDWPANRDPVEWFRDAHGRILDLFAQSESTRPSATWWPPDQTVGFWARRMAQETAVHRVDVELAAGMTTPVDRQLATDGVDEVLERMLAGDWSEDPDDAATGQRVAISTGGRTWFVTLEREAMSVSEDGKARDAAIEGDPSDVLLWLWGRAPDDRVTFSGDEAMIRLTRARLVMATQ